MPSTDDLQHAQPLPTSRRAGMNAYRAGMYNNRKLKQLPQELQDILMTLTRDQAKALRSCLSQQKYFDFFGVPIEIRLMILEELFQSGNGQIYLSGSEFTSPEVERLKQVSEAFAAEVMTALHSTATVVLPFRQQYIEQGESPLKWLSWPDAAGAFRHFELHVVTHDVRLNSKSEDTREPRGALLSSIEFLQVLAAGQDPPKRTTVFVKFSTDYEPLGNDALQEYTTRYSRSGVLALRDTDDWKKPYFVGFLRLQLRHILDELQPSLNELPHVTFSTNIDGHTNNGIVWKREDDEQACFKDSTNRQMGVFVAEPDPGGHFGMAGGLFADLDENATWENLYQIDY